MRTLIKKISKLAALLLILLATFLAWRLWLNNRPVPYPNQATIKHHFEQSVLWLSDNYNRVENVQNPILWWMIKQAATASGNPKLTTLYNKYKKDHIDNEPRNVWSPMFDELYRPRMPDISRLGNLRAYQLFMLYGLSCDINLGEEAIIHKQLQPGFCGQHFLQPRCTTHQLMGLRFMQRYYCGNEATVAKTIAALQKDIIAELTWDFRTGDAYIQRLLMLMDTDAHDKIKPVWVNRFLEAQNEDGSWDDLDPLIPLGNNRVLALTSTLPKIGTIKGNFHTTAQAIWLGSMLLENTRQSQSRRY